MTCDLVPYCHVEPRWGLPRVKVRTRGYKYSQVPELGATGSNSSTKGTGARWPCGEGGAGTQISGPQHPAAPARCPALPCPLPSPLGALPRPLPSLLGTAVTCLFLPNCKVLEAQDSTTATELPPCGEPQMFVIVGKGRPYADKPFVTSPLDPAHTPRSPGRLGWHSLRSTGFAKPPN